MADIYYFLGHEQFPPEVLVRHAIIAEEAGFDGLIVSEHFNPWVADFGNAGFAFSTLGAIAQVTQKVKLITGVVTPIFRYHPAVIAQAASTIDRLSGGRMMLGIGSGETINEIGLGYDFGTYTERMGKIKEAVYIIKNLLNGNEINFDGKYFKAINTKLYSTPFSNIPIYLAASGPKSIKTAIEIADGLITTVKDVKQTKSIIDDAGAENFNKLIPSWTVYAKDIDEAYDALKSWRGLRAPSRETATSPLQLQEEVDKMSKQDIVQRFPLISSPDEYISYYREIDQVLKPNIIAIQTTSIMDQVELIKFLGKEVLPNLRK